MPTNYGAWSGGLEGLSSGIGQGFGLANAIQEMQARKRQSAMQEAALKANVPNIPARNIYKEAPEDLLLNREEAVKGLGSQAIGNMFTLGQIDPRFAGTPQGSLPVSGKQAANVAQTGFQQSALPPNETQQISEMSRAPAIIQGLRKKIEESKGTMGPIKGRVLPALGRLGYESPDTLKAQGLQASYETAKQIVAKGLEGGVLRKEDMPKYEKILGSNWLTPEVAQQNLNQLEELLGESYNNYLNMLQGTGRTIPNEFRVFKPKATAKPKVIVLD